MRLNYRARAQFCGGEKVMILLHFSRENLAKKEQRERGDRGKRRLARSLKIRKRERERKALSALSLSLSLSLSRSA